MSALWGVARHSWMVRCTLSLGRGVSAGEGTRVA